MIYCKKCLYPSTKPDIMFGIDGICSACNAFSIRETIDWSLREKLFLDIINPIKELSAEYDCIVPVSGGKDSHYQVIKALEHGLRILAVTATTDHLSNLGRKNLDNISNLGVDHIEITPNKLVRRKINKHTLMEIGDISWAEHVAIFTIPMQVAIQKKIPLIIWGENPQNEYGGPLNAQVQLELNRRWLEEYGGLNGLRVSDIIETKVATQLDMSIYKYPTQSDTNFKVKNIFLGQFFPWDGLDNANIAISKGFRPHYGPVEGIGYDYENLDNYQTGIHDYFKYIKFGFGRATDLVNNHIRRKRITREEGKEIILTYDGRFPNTYLNKSIVDILFPIGVSDNEFMDTVHAFANKELFKVDKGKVPRALFKQDLEYA